MEQESVMRRFYRFWVNPSCTLDLYLRKSDMKLYRFMTLIAILASGMLFSCTTYMYRAICFSAGTEIYEGHVEIKRPVTIPGLLGMDVFPENSWLKTADGAYIRGDCVVQPMRIDGKDEKH